jgi:phage terminase large subunit-like protein
VSALLERSRLELAIDAFGGPEAFREWLCQQDPQRALELGYDWGFIARPKQLPPVGRWSTWMLRAGRGFGKTKTGAETVRLLVESGEYGNGALVAATAADARDIMVEGPSGILAVSPPWFCPIYEPSKRRLTWPNGATATLFSAEEPDRLRGPDKDFAWCDEIAAWQRLQETWDMLQFTLRRGSDPKCIVTSTPRGLKFLRDLEKDTTTVTTRGTTYENTRNLAAPFLKKIRDKYEGTRLGRQEIGAEILDDNPGALWKRGHIDAKRLTPAEFAQLGSVVSRVVVALDPATTSSSDSDENGIVCVGAGMCSCNGKPALHGFVFDDASEILSPNDTCIRVLNLYEMRMANKVVGETNQGGDWIESLLRAHDKTKSLPYHGVHAKDGKRLRADPVSALYEQRRVHHVGSFPKLEDEMTQWDPNVTLESPNRIDALVHGLTYLMVKPPPAQYEPRAPSQGSFRLRR